MVSFWRLLGVVALLLAALGPARPARAAGEFYIVIAKDEQRLYMAQGDPQSPSSSDVFKKFPVTTGALWTLKGLETPSGVFTVVDKTNNPVQGGYDFTNTGDVTLTPYFMRLNVPNRSGIGIHTYTGRTLDIWRFGTPGGETTHGCIAGPPQDVIPMYKQYVQVGKTRVWIVETASEAFKDLKPRALPTTTQVNGMQWEAMQSPTKEQFYSVSMVRSDLGWAVSGDVTVENGKYVWWSTIYKWDGRTWSSQGRYPYWIHSIRMLNENEGWAVGENYMAGLRYLNGKWTKVDRPIPRVPYMSDVAVFSPNDALIAGGGGEMFRWDGKQWKVVIAPEVMKTVRSLSMVDPQTGWAAGGGWDTRTKVTIPLIARMQNGKWSLDESPVDQLFYGVHALSASDAWAVGSGGAIIHWNGSAWQQVKSPITARLSSISMIGPNDGWIVGDEKGVALHWDGKAWTGVRLPVDQKFYSISTLKDGTAVAVGSGGSIIRLVKAEGPAAAPPVQPTTAPGAAQPTPAAPSQPSEPYAGTPVATAASTAVPAEGGEQLQPTQPAAGGVSAPVEAPPTAEAGASVAPTAPAASPAASATSGGSGPSKLLLGAGGIAVLLLAGLVVLARR